MALSSNQLEAFHCLAQTNHFTRASERLHITQSALSQRIGNLECELATTLFIRDRAGARLTQAGLELLRYCQVKDSLETEFLAKLKSKLPNMLAGNLRIGGFSSVTSSVLIPALSGFLKKHRDVRLSCQTRELYELPEMLHRGEVDFVALDHQWDRDGIAFIPVGEEENVLVEKKDYRGPDIYLDHDENDQTTERYFKAQKKKWSGKRHFLDDIHGIIQAVRGGVGRAVLARHLVDEDSTLSIQASERPFLSPVVLHYYEQPYYSKLHHAVVTELSEKCKTWLGSR